MSFTVESDASFLKVNPARGNKAPDKATSDSGREFSRILNPAGTAENESTKQPRPDATKDQSRQTADSLFHFSTTPEADASADIIRLDTAFVQDSVKVSDEPDTGVDAEAEPTISELDQFAELATEADSIPEIREENSGESREPDLEAKSESEKITSLKDSPETAIYIPQAPDAGKPASPMQIVKSDQNAISGTPSETVEIAENKTNTDEPQSTSEPPTYTEVLVSMATPTPQPPQDSEQDVDETIRPGMTLSEPRADKAEQVLSDAVPQKNATIPTTSKKTDAHDERDPGELVTQVATNAVPVHTTQTAKLPEAGKVSSPSMLDAPPSNIISTQKAGKAVNQIPATTPADAKPNNSELEADASVPLKKEVVKFEPHPDKPGEPDKVLSEGALIGSNSAAPTATPPMAQAPSTPSPQGMTSTHGIITASPPEVVKIISDAVAAPDDRNDRVVVQLDPPELGRVTIDFSFDSRGLQHVTITGDNPEALKHMRLMHFELTQALERNGLNSQNMTFQQQQSGTQQQSHQNQSARTLTNNNPSTDTTPAIVPPPATSVTLMASGPGGIDIKL